jgi:hypothetical protein
MELPRGIIASAMADWLETASVVLTKREPKTPMAFYLRIIWVILALIVVPPYSGLPEVYKTAFPIVGIVLFVVVLGWVGFLNYYKPKYLLYGEKSHFEEWKFDRKQAGSGQSLPARIPENNIPENVVGNQ